MSKVFTDYFREKTLLMRQCTPTGGEHNVTLEQNVVDLTQTQTKLKTQVSESYQAQTEVKTEVSKMKERLESIYTLLLKVVTLNQ